MPFSKKLTAVLLAAVLLVLTGVAGFTVFAADTVTVKIANIPRDSDNQSSSTSWGHPELKLMNGWTVHKETYFTVKILNDYDKGNAVYCIEPASALHTEDVLSKQAAAEEFFQKLPWNGTLNGNWQRKIMAAVLYHGYQGTASLTGWVTQNASGRAALAKYWATQLLLWEVIVGERDPNFNRLSVPSGYVSVDGFVMSGNPIRSDILSAMSDIEKKVKAELTAPSFLSQNSNTQSTYTLKYDSASKTYKTTLTDKNNVLGNWDISAPGVTATKSGNTLTLTSAQPLEKAVTLIGSRTVP
ncbi:MAG: thioester domain-containing protein, partial [Clostridia bacterium]|nr:thioester domain-containing protein [Clostridia bacterium]